MCRRARLQCNKIDAMRASSNGHTPGSIQRSRRRRGGRKRAKGVAGPVGVPVLDMRGISKRFPGVLALDHVDFNVSAGEVHCLLGHNGAGKSTLMKVLSGVYAADEGEIRIDGKSVTPRNPAHARQLGIRTVFQELSLVPALSVAENIFLERLPGRPAWVDRRQMFKAVREILKSLDIDVRPEEPVYRLSLATQQLIEIARAIAFRARVLIMDEPTASLSSRETETLFRIIRRLKAEGVAVVYISHRLEEIQSIGDRITVMRDGRNVGTLRVEQASTDTVVELMLGRRLEEQYPAPVGRRGEPVLSVRDLSLAGAYEGVSFDLYHQEILGITGQVGAGVHELAHSLFGHGPRPRGEIRIGGARLPHSPRAAIRFGMGFIPEDRRNAGLVLKHAIRENMALPSLRLRAAYGWLKLGEERRKMTELAQAVGLRMTSLEQPIGLLSGGNQQKVVVAKWLANRSRILLFAEPTRGVDVGSRAEIYRLIAEQVAGGASAILFSSDLEEVVGMCDRILVMRRGRIVGELGRGAREDQLLALAVGRADSGGGP